MIVTPFQTISLPASVQAQFPPCSAAKSTITEPGFICATISSVTSLGACLPGTWAVVITISEFLTWLATSSWVRFLLSSEISLA